MLGNDGVVPDAKNGTVSLGAISDRLVHARLHARPLDAFPGDLPDSLKAAYSIQSLSISAWPDEIVGWKVGGVATESQQQFDAERLSGPIFRSDTQSVSDGETIAMPVFDGGFAAVEAEFIVRTAAPIGPGEIDLAAIDVREMIASLYIGAETASSPMADINRLGPVAIVSDFGNNGGLVVGPAIVDWRDRLSEQITISVTVDAKPVGRVSAALEDGVFAAVSFLVDLCAARGIHLPAGTLVSCGALSGIHDVTVGSVAGVRFDGLGAFRVQFTQRQPAV
ncbi:MAG: 2-keto-4-pentenoate hydratase [Pseudomonadota bacterium]